MAKLNDSFNSNGVAESVAVNSDGSENGTETAFENPVMKIIRGFPNVSDEVIRAIRDSDVMHMDLSALSDEDLRLFGIEDATTRREMMVKFSTLPNQAMHFDKFVQELNVPNYQETVYKNVRNQLRLMNMALESSRSALKVNPITYDKLVDEKTYVSTLNAKALKEILTTISYMIRSPSEAKSANKWFYPIVGIALLSSILIFRKMIKL